MPLNLKSLFSAGAEKLVKAVGNAFDQNFTNKEEKAAAQLAITQEINRNMEALEDSANKAFEIEVQDRTSARGRETEFVKATGHIDYLMWFLAIAAMAIFGYMVFSVINEKIVNENRELIFHIFGIVEGVLLSIFSYYFGSSAGSRIKDMKPK